MTDFCVKDEYAPLAEVVLGTAASMGPTPSMENAYDPKSKEHIAAGTYPIEKDIALEMSAFETVLLKHGVKVHRPDTIADYNQVFSRDIGCVIEDKFIRTRMIAERSREIEAIESILNGSASVVTMPEDARLEGGDIMPHDDHIFIGYSEEPDFSTYKVARTNRAGVDFVRELFPDKTVKGFELVKCDYDPYKNCLHLDCCFQPLGKGHCIFYEKGFKNADDAAFVKSFFGEENCFLVDTEEMYQMFCNVFSISPDVVVSEKSFTRLNTFLTQAGYQVETIPYSETAKMEGLLRCSTLPLRRSY